MARYFVLGQGASTFWDPTTRTKVITHDEKNAVEFSGKMSKRLALALRNGHIKEVNKSRSAQPEVEEEEVDLSTMDDKQLEAYYTTNYKVNKKDLKTFQAMSTEEKVKFLGPEEEEETEE